MRSPPSLPTWALLLGVAACGKSGAPPAGPSPPSPITDASTPPPVDAASEAIVTDARAPSDAASDRAPKSTVHPVLKAWRTQASAWDSVLAGDLAPIDLRDTAGADTDRLLEYALGGLRDALVVPVMSKSRDRALRGLRDDLARISRLGGYSIPHQNLKMGPFTPTACEGCDDYPPRCDRARCEKAQRYLAPAVLSAAGLSREATFHGHPRAMDDGVGYTPAVTLSSLFDAAVEGGLSRAVVRREVIALTQLLVRRSRHLDRPDSASGEAREHALVRGFDRWRETYAPELEPRTFPPVETSDAARLAREERFIAFARAALKRFQWPSARKLAASRAAYRRRTVDAMKAELAGKPVDWSKVGDAPQGDACSAGPPTASRQCRDVEAALAHLSNAMEDTDDEKVALETALGLEQLSLADFSTRDVVLLYARWLGG